MIKERERGNKFTLFSSQSILGGGEVQCFWRGGFHIFCLLCRYVALGYILSLISLNFSPGIDALTIGESLCCSTCVVLRSVCFSDYKKPFMSFHYKSTTIHNGMCHSPELTAGVSCTPCSNTWCKHPVKCRLIQGKGGGRTNTPRWRPLPVLLCPVCRFLLDFC